MSMGRWVFSIYSWDNFQCGIFRWSMRSSSMSPWRGGWTSEPCWWRGRSLSSIYLSINLRQHWETFKLKTTFKTNLWKRWSRRRLWWRKLNGSRWVFIWTKENRDNMQGKQSVRRISKILRKNTDYWNFDYAENGRTFWGVRLWCLTGEISAWSNFGVSSVGHLQFPCQTLPGHFGASSQSSLLATKKSTFDIILQLLFRLTKI